MNYKQFKSTSSREDASKNDNIHFFSTHFAPLISFTFYKAGFSPNQVTSLVLLVGVSSSLFLFYSMPILAYAMWRLHIIIDMADGNLARAKQIFSDYAVGFDRSNHIIINTTILLTPLYLSGNLLLANCLIIAFYLYYFFSRNFYEGKSSVSEFSLQKNMLRNVFGLEGYITTQCFLVYFEYFEFIEMACIFYSISFFGLFLLKLFIETQKK